MALNAFLQMIGVLISETFQKQNILVGKNNTQRIERKILNPRTRIIRIVRQSICFSKSEKMHDIVIGLFINIHEFKIAI